MKQDQSLIKEACRAYKKGKYLEASALTENIGHSSGGPWVKYLAALSSLHLDRLSFAIKLTEEIKRDSPDFAPAYQLSAYLNLKSANDRESAVAGYAAALAKHPRDSYLRKGMKAAAGAGDFRTYQRRAKVAGLTAAPEPGKFVSRSRPGRYAGRIHRGFNLKLPFAAASLLLLTAGLVYAGYFLFQKAGGSTGDVSSVDTSQVDLASIGGSERELIERVSKLAAAEFYGASSALYEDYNTARALIKKGDYNRALLLLNKINNSNASFNVKERAEFLIKFVIGIDERNFEAADYNLIKAKPYLYRGAALLVRGRVANLVEKNDSFHFTLLLDYRSEERFSGTAAVFSQRGVPGTSFLKSGAVIEADALYVSRVGGENYYLTAKKIRDASL